MSTHENAGPVKTMGGDEDLVAEHAASVAAYARVSERLVAADRRVRELEAALGRTLDAWKRDAQAGDGIHEDDAATYDTSRALLDKAVPR